MWGNLHSRWEINQNHVYMSKLQSTRPYLSNFSSRNLSYTYNSMYAKWCMCVRVYVHKIN